MEQRAGMRSSTAREIVVIATSSTQPKSHAGGAWSRQYIDEGRIPGAQSTLGFSHFPPGANTALIQHAVEEVCLVVRGKGEIVTDSGTIPFEKGDAIHIPAGSWHGVHNTGHDVPVEMVFTFPSPRYPETGEAP